MGKNKLMKRNCCAELKGSVKEESVQIWGRDRGSGLQERRERERGASFCEREGREREKGEFYERATLAHHNG